jgi:hypothetical protein
MPAEGRGPKLNIIWMRKKEYDNRQASNRVEQSSEIPIIQREKADEQEADMGLRRN